MSFSQEGFINIYDLGYSSSSFRNVTLDNDTLLCVGRVYDNRDSLWKVSFTKMDTLGNMFFTRSYIEPEGRMVYLRDNCEIIKTSDEGYIMNGHDYSSAYFLKTDNYGELEFYKRYEFDEVVLVAQKEIIEIEDGFLLCGTIQEDDAYYSTEVYVIKTDKHGNEQWRRMYGEPFFNDTAYRFIKINKNRYAIGGGHHLQYGPTSSRWLKSKITVIDSLGNIHWEWLSEDRNSSIKAMCSTSDGGWAFINGYSETYSSHGGDWASRFRFVQLDSTGHIIHEKFLEPFDNSDKLMYDMISDGRGNWITSGELEYEYDSGGEAYVAWTIKLDAEGDTLWTRKDTVVWNSEIRYGTATQGGIVALPSGNTIGAGYTNYYSEAYTRSYAFLIKLDKDGCIIPGCRPPVSTTTTQYIPEVKVFPNPATDQIYVRAENPFSLEVYDASGKIYFRRQEQGKEISIDASLFSEGMYFLRMRFDDERVVLHKVIKH